MQICFNIFLSLYMYVLIVIEFRSRCNWVIESFFEFTFLQSSLGGIGKCSFMPLKVSTSTYMMCA
jgi:hypothetical protein